MNTKIKNIILLLTVVLSLLSCEKLDVNNYNDPDRERVLSNARDIKTLGEDAYRSYWSACHSRNIQLTALVAADQYTASWGNFAWRVVSNEPRIPWVNSTDGTDDRVAENFWFDMYAALSQSNDVLIRMKEGVDIGTNGVENPMMKALCKHTQGLILGKIALAFDKGYVVTEYSDPEKVEFVPYTVLMDSAINILNEVISICSSNTFTLGANVINGLTITNEDIARMSHSYIARFMVLNARTADENKNTDWDKVLKHADSGITKDFAPKGNGQRSSGATWFDENFEYLNKPDWARIDCRIINLMDKKYPSRYPVDGDPPTVNPGTPGVAISLDKRLQKDFQFLPSVNFLADRGYWHFSHYRYSRFYSEMGEGTGALMEFRKYENDLLKAEAYAMLGQLSNALDILNSDDNPRKDINRGNLSNFSVSNIPSLTEKKLAILDVIFYERDIELIGQGFLTAFCDMRRRDMLQYGTFLHFPVPAKELETIKQPIYTFGGANNVDGINTSNGGWFK